MGADNSQKPTKPIVVEHVATFRRIQTPYEICVLPEIFQRRKITDVAFLIAFGLCAVLLLGFLIYALVNSDIQRFIHGYDQCGNVCGSKNPRVEGISCSGRDMTNKPYLEYDYDLPNRCVESCDSSYTIKFHRCFRDGYDANFAPNVVITLQEEAVDMTVLCFVGLGLSIVALILFRYFTQVFVWSMLILVILLLFAFAGFMWYGYSTALESDKSIPLAWAIIITVVASIFAWTIVALKKRIALLIFFFHEAVRVVFAMPLLLLEPVLTFISNFVVMAIFLYTLVLMLTSGSLQEDTYSSRYDYFPNGVMIFAICWSVIMMWWMLMFTLACQQMVISGAVATYYFARDKLAVVSPIYNSFHNLVRYHLGTAAFGSLIYTVITILKVILRTLANENACFKLLYLCFKPLEDLLKYLTTMGYIETAIHGQPLCRSSVRAINLIISNLLSALVINSIANLVFLMAKLVVVAITVMIGVFMQSSLIIIVIAGLVALMCVHCFFVVFEIAVDTIFLCYCEDQCINDGNANSYYATLELHNQIKKAQALTLKLLAENEKKRSKK